MELIDSHAHLDDPRFDEDRDAVLRRAAGVGVRRIITVGAEPGGWEKNLGLIRAGDGQRPAVHLALGCHPHEAASFDDAARERLRTLLKDREVVAVGETGLDYHYEHSPRDAQRAAMRAHLALALESALPVILHIREAMEEALAILRECRNAGLRGVAHCFSGDAEAARQLLDMGLHISFAGTVTFRKADALRQAAAVVPPERLLVETDCPYLAPEPVRGKRNEPANVRHTLHRLAGVKRIAADDLAARIAGNTEALFRLR